MITNKVITHNYDTTLSKTSRNIFLFGLDKSRENSHGKNSSCPSKKKKNTEKISKQELKIHVIYPNKIQIKRIK